jgi:hypothetical protein
VHITRYPLKVNVIDGYEIAQLEQTQSFSAILDGGNVATDFGYAVQDHVALVAGLDFNMSVEDRAVFECIQLVRAGQAERFAAVGSVAFLCGT